MSIFNSVALRPPKKSLFDMSFSNKMSVAMGLGVPILTQECVPGDVFRHSHQLFCQLAPMNSQVMQRFDLQVHYFFVPIRLIYSDFEKFLVGGKDGTETFVPPFLTAGNIYDTTYGGDGLADVSGNLLDYLGLPSNIANLGSGGTGITDLKLSALPFRAYWKIYDDYFRDENLCDEMLISVAGGEITGDEYAQLPFLFNRAWRKDYFTSALPWTQKGVEVVLPLGDKAPVKMEVDEFNHVVPMSDTSSGVTGFGHTYDPVTQIEGDADQALYADLAAATGASIDQLRTAEMVQEWLEKNARGGTRYNEQIYSHFGVRTPDSRLDRCEYICKSSSPITFGNVYSSNSNNGDNIQGQPVSTGQSQQASGNFKYKVREHGYIMGILSILPRAAYYQGIPKRFIRNDKFDYYWPEFANLGEQAIKDYELYVDANTDVSHDFGYNSRYSDQKFNADEIHGDFRSDLKYMHDARRFAAQPTLSKNFIECNESRDDLRRIFNSEVVGTHHFYIDCFHNFKAKRPMPYYGVPMFHV